MLQFGHDPEVVDDPSNLPPVNLYDELQFGHDPEVVDDRQAARSVLPNATGFNSATTLKSWMTKVVVR